MRNLRAYRLVEFDCTDACHLASVGGHTVETVTVDHFKHAASVLIGSTPSTAMLNLHELVIGGFGPRRGSSNHCC